MNILAVRPSITFMKRVSLWALAFVWTCHSFVAPAYASHACAGGESLKKAACHCCDHQQPNSGCEDCNSKVSALNCGCISSGRELAISKSKVGETPKARLSVISRPLVVLTRRLHLISEATTRARSVGHLLSFLCIRLI